MLNGGVGNDRLTGGTGADVFVFNPVDGAVGDTIADFQDGTDLVRIRGSSFGDLHIADSGGDAAVTWGGKQHPDAHGSGPYPAHGGRLRLRLMPPWARKEPRPTGARQLAARRDSRPRSGMFAKGRDGRVTGTCPPSGTRGCHETQKPGPCLSSRPEQEQTRKSL